MKDLRVREDTAKADGRRQTFERIPQTAGYVQEDLLASVGNWEGEHTWLGAPPDNREILRCLRQMKNGKACGGDEVVAEMLKYGGGTLHAQLCDIVRTQWASATQAEHGEEAQTWPTAWTGGIVVPLWKQKGDRQNRNTWRGITLLSVGSKLLARVVAARLATWAEDHLHESQCGFRRGRGVEDCLQMSRRVVEEVNNAVSAEWVRLSFFRYREGLSASLSGSLVASDGKKRVPPRHGERLQRSP
jgi:hypothetical protein